MKTRAFSLVEIMVVVIIIGILASMALMRYDKTLLYAREKDAVSQLKVIHSANTLFHSRQGHYMLTGTGDLAAINQGMGLNILANDLSYHYIFVEQDGAPGPSAGDGYQTTVAFVSNGGNVLFGIKLDQGPLSEEAGQENPCCDTQGKCLFVPDC